MQVSEIRSYRLSDDGNQVYTLSNIFTSGFTVLFYDIVLKGDADDEGWYNTQHPHFPR